MPLPYVYRITKYDPADRAASGNYIGDVDASSDHGFLEAAYLEAIRLIATELGVERLLVREPAFYGASGPDSEVGPDESVLREIVPGGFADFRDGSAVSLERAVRIVQAMLRDEPVWCRLEVEAILTVHIGWDQYMYVGMNQPCESALEQVRGSGLFPERLDRSPYEFVPDETFQRPADDAFWARLRRNVISGEASVLQTLHEGQVISGTVTRIAPYFVTYVDVGGFEAMVNIPEVSFEPIGHPQDVLSPGQVVRARILMIDDVRERVSLSLKLFTWEVAIRAALDQVAVGFEERMGYPFDPGANRIAGPGPGTTPGVGPLAQFYEEIGEVSLSDIGNGYFIHPLDTLGRLPMRVEGLGEVVTFGSDGGGELYCLSKRDEAVYRLSLGAPSLVAANFGEFLSRLLAAVRRFAASGEVSPL